MKSTAKSLIVILITMLATAALAQTALPGQVEKATNFMEALMKGKWVMIVGGAMIMGFGWRVYKGQLTLEEFGKVTVGLICLFGGLPIGYALYAVLGN